MKRCLRQFPLIVLVLLLVSSALVHAAHSRRRIVVRREVEPQYDRSITTFSADGRLAQVEYGMEAALRGSTIAAVECDRGICLVLQNGSFGKVHRIDHHLWLITSGISGDARALAMTLRTSCQKHRLEYGEPPTTKQVARMAGQAQHQLTRQGGARPLGCTSLVVGIDPSYEDDNVLGTPQLYQTDPGGIVEKCTFCAAGKGHINVAKVAGSTIPPSSPAKNKSSRSIQLVAADLAKRVIEQLDDPKGTPTVDVWTIQPNAKKRGGMQATCYKDIQKGSLSKIRETI